MRHLRRALAALACATVLPFVASCGGGVPADATVRLVNATLDYDSLDLFLDDEREIRGVARGTTSDYEGVASDRFDAALAETGQGTLLAESDVEFGRRDDHTLIAYGRRGQLQTKLLTDDESEPSSGRVKLRVLHGAADAGEVDVYLVPDCSAIGDASPVASSVGADELSAFTTRDSGTYSVCVTTAGDDADLRLALPGIVLGSRDVVTLVTVPSSGGFLVSALLVKQDDQVLAYENPEKRLRIVNAVASGTAVAVGTASGASDLGSTAVASVGSYLRVSQGLTVAYVRVGAGAATAVSLDGASGSDQTLLVAGADGSVTPRVLDDDNRPAADAGKYKVRLVHGLLGAASTLQLQLSLTSIGSATYADASGYVERSAATDDVLVLSGSSAVYGREDYSFEAGGVYTVFVLGSTTSISASVTIDRASSTP